MKALILGVLLLAVSAQAESYTLACRGGDLTSIHWSQGNFPQPDKVRFTFFKTAQGHNSSSVQPNQCAWLDRKVRHNEPGQVCFYGLSARSFSFERYGKHLATSWDGPTDAKRTLGDIFGSRVFFLQVINRNGCLEFVRRGT